MGMELLCRQVEFIGNVQGPFSVKEILKLSSRDFATLQQKARELDDIMFSDDALEGLRLRGEIKSLAAHLELMLINVGSRYPVSDFNHQPIRRLIQLIFD